jgi:hypothetical protein
MTARTFLQVAVAAAAALTLACGAAASTAATPVITSTLPLVVIDAPRTIPADPKVTARMRVINVPGRRNSTRDRGNVYDGLIGIESRGHSSARFPKKSYSVETRTPLGKSRNVSLLGMPPENDWILYASYNDKTLMRNTLAHWTARKLGRYSSRIRYVDVVLNGRYEGVYVLMERVKLGANRVNASKGDITGGYVLEGTVLKQIRKKNEAFRAAHTGKAFIYHDPKGKNLARDRAEWISNYVGQFEKALYSDSFRDPQQGYAQYLDIPAAVDYVLVNELFKNQDAFQTSMYLSKSAGGKLRLGPVWDFDLSSGNSTYFPSSVLAGWMLERRPWAVRLYKDPDFTAAMARRWKQLQAQGFTRQLLRAIDLYAVQLRGPQARNFQRWQIMGKLVWQNQVNPSTGRPFATYTAEVNHLKSWLQRRSRWIDANIDGLAAASRR